MASDSGVNRYTAVLSGLPVESWDAYLTEHSGLPGPRANLELADAFATAATREDALAHAHSADEYLRFCGTQALGVVLAKDADANDLGVLLKERASDASWRVREAAARGLQFVGDVSPEQLCVIAAEWQIDADPYVRRAALAALAEPRLLVHDGVWTQAMASCVAATARLAELPAEVRRQPGVRTLRTALGYCWSVVVAASPQRGLPEFEALRSSTDRDVQWVVRSNLAKSRLRRLMPD